ncbi:MAG: deoxyribose-phosphate aldolase, partial [Ruminiclostridium sp.]|nr:deoxyribose-phosphate aldolase [Ruminiclostridium sp.]
MTNEEILGKIDHTLLSPTATLMQIRTLCIEALDYKTASVCIPPSYVKKMHEEFPTLNICTVIGFPLGYEITRAKVVEAEQAIADGANEIDMVVNLTAVKNHDFDYVIEEIQAVKRVCGDHILKVIVETCYLNEDEKVMLCHSVTTAGADYIKTSTGFGTDGATKEDIKLFSKNI